MPGILGSLYMGEAQTTLSFKSSSQLCLHGVKEHSQITVVTKWYITKQKSCDDGMGGYWLETLSVHNINFNQKSQIEKSKWIFSQ